MRDLYYFEEFRMLEEEHENFTFVPALSAPEKDDEWHGETGFIHAVLDRHLENGTGLEAYLCGPPVMIDAVFNVLISKGVDKEDIFFDRITV